MPSKEAAVGNLKLSFTEGEWNEFSGEQKLVLALLESVVRELEKRPTAKGIAEIEDWLTFDGPMGPKFCDETLELDEGVIAAHVRRKVEAAKCRL